MIRGVSLILVAALLSQTAGCYTTRIHQTIGEEIKEEELQKGMLVYMTLRPESGLLKSDKTVREFECVINRVDPKNNTIVVVAFNKFYDIKLSDIQKIEVIYTAKEEVFSKGKTLPRGTIIIVEIIASIMAVLIAVAAAAGAGAGGTP